MNRTKMLRQSLLILLTVISFFACSKKSDNPVAPTTPSTELKLTLGSQQLTFSQGIGGYAIQENVTYVQFTKAEAGDTLFFFLVTSGKQTGNQPWDSNQDTGVLLFQYGNSGTIIYSPSQGSTNLTSYGNVGSSIAGSFSGTLVDDNQSQISVSGNFSVQRSADVNTIGKKISNDILNLIQLVEM
ncbi:hypothetical protein [Ignavibacterium album]|uniref:hypothetical protein n=1 Tax=Ignavibacterium album TaxID=591197 RepID=UPI0035B95530